MEKLPGRQTWTAVRSAKLYRQNKARQGIADDPLAGHAEGDGFIAADVLRLEDGKENFLHGVVMTFPRLDMEGAMPQDFIRSKYACEVC